MDTNTILALISGVIGLVTVLIGRRANTYFASGNRAARARLVQILAKDILALVVLQKGVGVDRAEIIRLAIDQLYTTLVGQGFSKDTAHDIAKSAISGAAADQGFDLASLTL